MSCTYCNNKYHSVQECEHPDSVPFYAQIAPKLKKYAYDFWELYKLLEPLTVGQIEMIMVSLGGPIDVNKLTLIICIIELNFEYELAKNDFTDANAITCAVIRALLLVKLSLKNTATKEREICRNLLTIRVGNLVTETADKIVPIIKDEVAEHPDMDGADTIKQIGFDLFYTTNPFNRLQRSREDPEVWVDFEDTADLLFKAPLVIKPMVVHRH